MFKTESSNAKIVWAVDLANELILARHGENKQLYDKFYGKIEKKKSFDMATCDPIHVSISMQKAAKIIPMYILTYHNRFTRSLAYFVPSKPQNIYINTAKLNRSLGSIAATFIHEFVHLTDNWDKEHSYGHGDNSPIGKQNTAPYWIDNLAQAVIDGEPNFNNNESSRIVYKRSIWSRLKDWIVFWK